MQKILHNVNIWVWLAAVVVLAAGLLWTAHNAVMAPKWAEAMRKQTVVWEQLRAVEAAQQAAHSRLAVLRELPHPVRPAPLTRLAIECTPDARPEVLDRGVRALPDGWQARQMEMQYGEVDLETVGAWLNAAAGQRPPWTLCACKIEASTQRAGHGRVTLRLESLERD